MTIFHIGHLDVAFWDFLSEIWMSFCSTHELSIPAGLTATEDSHHALSPGRILDKNLNFLIDN